MNKELAYRLKNNLITLKSYFLQEEESIDFVFTNEGVNMLDVGGISIPLDQVISVNREKE